VDIGVRAFVPGSQYDLRPTQNLDDLTARTTGSHHQTESPPRNVVVSRRALLEEEQQAKRGELWNRSKKARSSRFVKNVTEYGAFVDLAELTVLLHLTDLSWAAVKHPSTL